jgi:hypothetical protein
MTTFKFRKIDISTIKFSGIFSPLYFCYLWNLVDYRKIPFRRRDNSGPIFIFLCSSVQGVVLADRIHTLVLSILDLHIHLKVMHATSQLLFWYCVHSCISLLLCSHDQDLGLCPIYSFSFCKYSVATV